ncbi:hypothetical protein QYF36_018319 [Acer negundo]|nr:hypothetical protein QYF36_018319 [Acer negundo]
MEETINRLSEALLSNKEGSRSNANDPNGRFSNNGDDSKEHTEARRQMFLFKLAKLEFPNGSTHNFINDKVADMLRLPVVLTEPFIVKVANGKPLKCQGRFEHVYALLQAPLWDEIKAEVVGHPYMDKIGKMATERPGVPYTWRNGMEKLSWNLNPSWIHVGLREVHVFFKENLVKWKHLPLDDATLEDIKELRDQFLNVNLEDKVPVDDGGIDMPRRSQRIPKKNPRFLT